jgi:hypothetical protein
MMQREVNTNKPTELENAPSKWRQKFKISFYSTIFNFFDKINSPKISFNNKAIIDELEKKGIVVIPDYYSEEQCRILKSEVEQLMTDYKDRSWTDEVGSDTRLYGTELVSKEIQKYYADEYLLSIGSAYLKTKLVNLTTLANRVKFSPDNWGSGHGWHRDTLYYKQFKSITYLADTSEENGPFEYLIGSHTTSSIFKAINGTSVDCTSDRLTEDDINAISKLKGIERRSFPGKAGTVILVNTLGIHRGMPIRSGTRYALTNYYFQSYINEYAIEKWNRQEYIASPLPVQNRFKYGVITFILQIKRFFSPPKA